MKNIILENQIKTDLNMNENPFHQALQNYVGGITWAQGKCLTVICIEGNRKLHFNVSLHCDYLYLPPT